MRRRLVPVIMALIALVLIALFLDSMVFVIKDVEIVGESGMADTDVIRLAQVDMGGRMRGVDGERIVRSIEQSGTLKCLNVETKLPSTIVITVELRDGRLVTDYGGSVALMDAEGYVISTTREIPEGEFLYVTGLSPALSTPGRRIGADDARIRAMSDVIYAIDRTGCMEYISELNVEDPDALYMFSRTGIQVALGDSGNMEAKLIWMKYALIDLEARGETTGHLDVASGDQADYSRD